MMNLSLRKIFKNTTFSALYKKQLCFFTQISNGNPFVFSKINKDPSSSKNNSDPSLSIQKIQQEKKASPKIRKGQKHKFRNIETFQDRNKKIQMEILDTQSLASLFELYKNEKIKMNLVNLCTCLNQAVILSEKDELRRKIAERTEIKEIIEKMEADIPKMNEFTVSNFLSNLVKLELMDHNIGTKLIQRTLVNITKHNEKSLAYIIWGLAKFNIKDEEFLDAVAKRIITTVIFFFSFRFNLIERRECQEPQ